MEKQLDGFKLKSKHGIMSMLYKNYKFDLCKSLPEADFWICIRNGYRFIISLDKATDYLALSYSKNNFVKKDFVADVIYVNERIINMKEALELFEITLDKLSSIN